MDKPPVPIYINEDDDQHPEVIYDTIRLVIEKKNDLTLVNSHCSSFPETKRCCPSKDSFYVSFSWWKTSYGHKFNFHLRYLGTGSDINLWNSQSYRDGTKPADEEESSDTSSDEEEEGKPVAEKKIDWKAIEERVKMIKEKESRGIFTIS